MAFPKTEQELAAAGYVYKKTEPCKGPTCDAIIAWYLSPTGKWCPLVEGTLEPHFANCPDADKFRRGGK